MPSVAVVGDCHGVVPDGSGDGQDRQTELGDEAGEKSAVDHVVLEATEMMLCEQFRKVEVATEFGYRRMDLGGGGLGRR